MAEEPVEIRYVGDLQRLQPKPDDVFVLMYPQALSVSTREYLQSQWKVHFPNHQLLVIDSGGRLAVIEKPDYRR